MKLSEAERLTHGVIELLSPTCVKVEVAGGIRRRKAEPHDCEIVCLPQMGVSGDLFGTATVEFSPLEEHLRELIHHGALAFDQRVRRNGPRYKRLLVRGEVVELFIASADNYGNILAIRTGDADFSHALVTPRRMGGLMPGHLRQRDGYLINLYDHDARIPCPTEQNFFDALGIPSVEPPFRNAANARNLARHAALEVL